MHNGGPDPASAVTVDDPLPSGLSLVSASTTKGTCSGTTTVSCAIGTVNAGAAERRDGHDRRDRRGERRAERHQHRHGDHVHDGSGGSNNQASAQTTVNPTADLSLQKSDAPDPASAGGRRHLTRSRSTTRARRELTEASAIPLPAG